MDSLTRLVRSYNYVVPSSGKVWSGGLDPAALQLAKKIMGVARNTTEGGSVTVIATALIGTGSKMDDLIYEECKGTGNSELLLDKSIVSHKIFPGIHIQRTTIKFISYFRSIFSIYATN